MDRDHRSHPSLSAPPSHHRDAPAQSSKRTRAAPWPLAFLFRLRMLRAAPRHSNRSGAPLPGARYRYPEPVTGPAAPLPLPGTRYRYPVPVTGPTAMAPRPPPELQELQELSTELGRVMLSERSTALLRQGLELQARGSTGVLAAQEGAARMDTELRATEQAVAQVLLSREAALQRGRRRLQDLRQELRSRREESGSLRESNGALARELAELREQQRQQEEEREREEEGLVSMQYLLHLFHKLSLISWDSEAKPWHVKGIHFGPSIAQPLDIDGRHHSQCFISDYLWSLIPHQW
ncbi:kinetochore protein Spc24 [Melopsittacus undulatus]|uniref:kinetochore protein Spc24 n=1 Tax=Melopsittacus undulatus TaxID=13146 RepID=UPI00146AC552|nr:kinetochore protein Spc24 [Melopsittacus undulatus]